MGRLIDGRWHDVWYDTQAHGGRFMREDARFRNRIGADTPYPAQRGRYHLYVSLACPWAHRTLIVRTLKRLEEVIDISIVHWYMREDGWTFREQDGASGDRVNGCEFLWQLYVLAKPDYTGRVTVPLLWDRATNSIVNNESADIMRILNRDFDAYADRDVDLCPEALRGEIDAINAYVYERINNGVYQAGFATRQAAYEEAFERLFEGLDHIEARLADRDWLVGDRLTEVDVRLFTTLLRFDPVYHTHFKCNLRRIRDYPRLSAHVRRMLAVPGIARTVNLHHIKHHYYVSHDRLNPSGVVPKGPEPVYGVAGM